MAKRGKTTDAKLIAADKTNVGTLTAGILQNASTENPAVTKRADEMTAANEKPADGASTNSTDTPSEDREGGAGNPAGPAATSTFLAEMEAKFREACPHLAAAIDAWEAAGKEGRPVAVRIAAKRDGFRRAGMAHSKAPAEHPIETFREPEQLEQLLGEPNLVVELI